MVSFKVLLFVTYLLGLFVGGSIADTELATNEVKKNETDGIWCFQCNSARQKECWDIEPNDKKSLFYKRCPGFDDEHRAGPNATYFCRKITQTVMTEDVEEKRVIRSCGWMKQKEGCYKITNPAHREMVCACNTDGCNSAPRQNLLSPVLLLSSSALICAKLLIYTL